MCGREGRHHHAGACRPTGYCCRRPSRSRLDLTLAHQERLPLQKKRCWPASKIDPTSARRARSGGPNASRGCGLSHIG
ncbi:hypothetical protein, partial [Mesorhizobium sp.]|uniref:hypothetical protein n=1 Tax=Mesorhizobium sp. TaxID=1871066 RepID=UPI00344C2CBE